MKRLSERRLAQVQVVSGLVFATFLCLHLVNTMVAAFGQGAYDGYMRAVRLYYQAPGVEVVLIGLAPVVHVAAGVVRALRRRKKERSKKSRPAPLRMRLHRASGVVLLLAFVGHVTATRGPGVLFDQPASFSFLTYSLETYPFFFYPYYAIFASSGLYHLVHGVLAAFPLLGIKVPRRWLEVRSRRFFGLVAVGSIALLIGLVALGGSLFEVDRSSYPQIEALWERFTP